ncbi:MAG TPA: SRPBCC domain-containing protein, partial [Streptomyces sp.]
SFHEARPDERLVQTFTYDGVPDGVSLDTATFEDLGDGRTRVTVLGLVDNLTARDMILASGMDRGVIEGYEQLDTLLRTLG